MRRYSIKREQLSQQPVNGTPPQNTDSNSAMPRDTDEAAVFGFDNRLSVLGFENCLSPPESRPLIKSITGLQGQQKVSKRDDTYNWTMTLPSTPVSPYDLGKSNPTIPSQVQDKPNQYSRLTPAGPRITRTKPVEKSLPSKGKNWILYPGRVLFNKNKAASSSLKTPEQELQETFRRNANYLSTGKPNDDIELTETGSSGKKQPAPKSVPKGAKSAGGSRFCCSLCCWKEPSPGSVDGVARPSPPQPRIPRLETPELSDVGEDGFFEE